MTKPLTINLVVILLGALGLTIVGGAIYLTAASHAVPGELWTLAGAAVGSLGSMLAKTSTEPTTTEAHITNTPSDPVPTEPAP